MTVSVPVVTQLPLVEKTAARRPSALHSEPPATEGSLPVVKSGCWGFVKPGTIPGPAGSENGET